MLDMNIRARLIVLVGQKDPAILVNKLTSRVLLGCIEIYLMKTVKGILIDIDEKFGIGDNGFE
ncbi:MAG: hypothetical protein WAM95_15500 [Bacillus sp. (in: firmicutes)]